MQGYKGVKGGFLDVVKSLSPLQRRFLAAMAAGAQVMQAPGSSAYQAWGESQQTGKLLQIGAGLFKADMVAMQLLLPMIEKGSNETWDYDYFYLPGAVRDEVKELLTLSMPAPPMIQMQVEWQLRQRQAGTPIDPSGDETADRFERPRMAMG